MYAFPSRCDLSQLINIYMSRIRAYKIQFKKWHVSKYISKPQAQPSPGYTAQALDIDTLPFSPIQHATLQRRLACKVESKWIWVETPGATAELVEVIEECASDDNFISPSQASRLGFQFKPVLDPAPAFLETTNSHFVPQEYVDITWMSQGFSHPPALSAPTETSAAYLSSLPEVLPTSTEERPLLETIPSTRGMVSSNYRMDELSSGEFDSPKSSHCFKSTDRFYVTPSEMRIQLLVGRKFIAQYPGVLMGEKPDRSILDRTSQVMSQNANTKSLLTPTSWAPTVDIGDVSVPLNEQQKTQDEQKFHRKQLWSKKNTSDSRTVSDMSATETFACPYLAYKPATYRSCLRYKLSRIADVKRHLKRCHMHPPYCPRCMETFTNEETRDEHIRMFSWSPNWKHSDGVGLTSSGQLVQ